jgi:hypothetical protein
LVCEPHNMDFTDIWSRYRGDINHYTDQGNTLIYNLLSREIDRRAQ